MASIDVTTFRELLKTELPRLLREHPESRHELWGLMLESFPSRQEFASLHQELCDFREETGQRFERLEGRIEEARQDLRGEIKGVRQGLEHRMDEGFQAVRQDLRGEIEGVRQGLEQRMDGGFQAVRQDLGAQIDGVRQGLEQRMDEGFQAVRQDLGAQIDGVRQDLGAQIDGVRQDLGAQIDGVRQDLDRLGSRWGIRNESIFRQTIATLLEKSFGAKVESRHIDGEEYDVIISDGAHILVEIAASAGPKVQERLERKRSIYAGATSIMPARVVLAVASIHSQRARALRDAGFEVIEPEEEALE